MGCLHVDVEGEAQVGGAHAVGEAVGSEERGALVGDHRDLQVGAALVVRARQVDVGVGRAVGRAEVPLAALAAGVLRLPS
eukprot:scaffold65552_cov43-Phaeocystis_antarctica.AAC.1